MSRALDNLAERIDASFAGVLQRVESTCGELTYELDAEQLIEVCAQLQGEEAFAFEQLIDICGVDYLGYGKAEWNTLGATSSGFSRGVSRSDGEDG
ncbi:MAG: NADH-quinone oxidoreductase subunit C, partial [Chromatiales bacterium]|nr:NADH-quinone oxidoreductase subunit C [Chromatiales bacterium]